MITVVKLIEQNTDFIFATKLKGKALEVTVKRIRKLEWNKRFFTRTIHR